MNSKRETFVLIFAIVSLLSMSTCAIAQPINVQTEFNGLRDFGMPEQTIRVFNIPASLNIFDLRSRPGITSRVREPSVNLRFGIRMAEYIAPKPENMQFTKIEIPEASAEVDESGVPFPVLDAHQVDKVATDNFVWTPDQQTEQSQTATTAENGPMKWLPALYLSLIHI